MYFFRNKSKKTPTRRRYGRPPRRRTVNHRLLLLFRRCFSWERTELLSLPLSFFVFRKRKLWRLCFFCWWVCLYIAFCLDNHMCVASLLSCTPSGARPFDRRSNGRWWTHVFRCVFICVHHHVDLCLNRQIVDLMATTCPGLSLHFCVFFYRLIFDKRLWWIVPWLNLDLLIHRAVQI